jgi:hypothetical protein
LADEGGRRARGRGGRIGSGGEDDDEEEKATGCRHVEEESGTAA